MAYTKQIVLGSGKLYCIPYVPGTVIGSLAAYCIEENRIGLIQGGAQISYTPTVYEVKDDMNVIYKRFITAEEATLTSGILTWNLSTLGNFIGNKSYYINEAGNKVMKLGGNGAREMDEYLVVFEHEFRNRDKLYVGMAGTNDAGLTLAFQPDKETVVDAEFRAISNDDSGCILILEQKDHADSFGVEPATTECVGGEELTFTIEGNVGRVYAQPSNPSIEVTVAPNNESATAYMNVAPGEYTITFTDSNEGGANEFTVDITVNEG